MTTEKSSETLVLVRGYGSFVHPASWSRRLLAFLTDLPIHLLGPFTGVLFLNQPPLPGLPVLALWLGWSLLIHFVPRRVFGRTLGGQIWGIQSFKGRGTLTRRTGVTYQVSAWVLLGAALLISMFMLRTTLVFHPMLLKATVVEMKVFDPDREHERDWTELPFFLTLGSFPRQIDGDPAWYLMPYAKGPPQRFPPRVVILLPRNESRMVIEGPRTPEALRGRRELVRSCLTSAALEWSISPECLSVRRALLKRHTGEMLPGGKSPASWEMQWFEVLQSGAPRSEADPERPMGVRLTARAGRELVHRYILITQEGQHQSITMDTRASAPAPEGDLPLLERVIGSLVIHSDLAPSQAWLEHRLASTNFGAIRGGGGLEKLGHAAALLIARATVDPGDADTYFELAGLSLVMLRKSTKTLASETVAAVSRPQALAAQKFMRDVAPEDPRNRQLEQMLRELKGF